jgi:hypothetical protein
MPLDTTKLYKGVSRVATSIKLELQDPNTQQWRTIGAVDSFDRTIAREVSRRREFDADVPGEVVEIIPGTTTINVGIRRAVLYTKTLLEEFGFNGVEDLILQRVPVNIRETRYSPPDSDAAGAQQVIEYQGCFFTSNPISYDLTRELTVIQDADLAVTRIRVTS